MGFFTSFYFAIRGLILFLIFIVVVIFILSFLGFIICEFLGGFIKRIMMKSYGWEYIDSAFKVPHFKKNDDTVSKNEVRKTKIKYMKELYKK